MLITTVTQVVRRTVMCMLGKCLALFYILVIQPLGRKNTNEKGIPIEHSFFRPMIVVRVSYDGQQLISPHGV